MKKPCLKFAVILLLLLTACNRENHFHLQQVGTNYTQHFAWWYKDQLYNMDIAIPVDLYLHYHNLPKTQPYNNYVLEDGGFKYLGYVSSELNKLVASQHLTDYEMAGFVLSFVQSAVPYQDDPIGFTDYPKYLAEFLCEKGGDCEDKAAAMCCLLLTYHIDAVLIDMPGHPGHEAVGVNCRGCSGTYVVYNNKRYYYCETTAPGVPIGWSISGFNKMGKEVLPTQQTASFDRFHPSLSQTQMTWHHEENGPVSSTTTSNTVYFTKGKN